MKEGRKEGRKEGKGAAHDRSGDYRFTLTEAGKGGKGRKLGKEKKGVREGKEGS